MVAPGRTDKLNAKALLKTQPHENQTKLDIREQEKNCRFRDTDNRGKELRRTNHILKTASAFFAQAELDRRLKS
ncbi:hypothetical protein N5J07_16535 [Comamonas aquatica]|uniref:hypothetical protein n=2 Tax=Comamonas aquatica TaxID=225991 RepID=UPI00244C8036|nr:hypothetical protein [Comamonas aquatica]MDH1381030.1 hypothetical protein [Comamonas aquatica]MDH1641094.1 hypothetical protein [Comamonas aquatica]